MRYLAIAIALAVTLLDSASAYYSTGVISQTPLMSMLQQQYPGGGLNIAGYGHYLTFNPVGINAATPTNFLPPGVNPPHGPAFSNQVPVFLGSSSNNLPHLVIDGHLYSMVRPTTAAPPTTPAPSTTAAPNSASTTTAAPTVSAANSDTTTVAPVPATTAAPVPATTPAAVPAIPAPVPSYFQSPFFRPSYGFPQQQFIPRQQFFFNPNNRFNAIPSHFNPYNPYMQPTPAPTTTTTTTVATTTIATTTATETTTNAPAPGGRSLAELLKDLLAGNAGAAGAAGTPATPSSTPATSGDAGAAGTPAAPAGGRSLATLLQELLAGQQQQTITETTITQTDPQLKALLESLLQQGGSRTTTTKTVTTSGGLLNTLGNVIGQFSTPGASTTVSDLLQQLTTLTSTTVVPNSPDANLIDGLKLLIQRFSTGGASATLENLLQELRLVFTAAGGQQSSIRTTVTTSGGLVDTLGNVIGQFSTAAPNTPVSELLPKLTTLIQQFSTTVVPNSPDADLLQKLRLLLQRFSAGGANATITNLLQELRVVFTAAGGQLSSIRTTVTTSGGLVDSLGNLIVQFSTAAPNTPISDFLQKLTFLIQQFSTTVVANSPDADLLQKLRLILQRFSAGGANVTIANLIQELRVVFTAAGGQLSSSIQIVTTGGNLPSELSSLIQLSTANGANPSNADLLPNLSALIQKFATTVVANSPDADLLQKLRLLLQRFSAGGANASSGNLLAELRLILQQFSTGGQQTITTGDSSGGDLGSQLGSLIQQLQGGGSSSSTVVTADNVLLKALTSLIAQFKDDGSESQDARLLRGLKPIVERFSAVGSNLTDADLFKALTDLLATFSSSGSTTTVVTGDNQGGTTQTFSTQIITSSGDGEETPANEAPKLLSHKIRHDKAKMLNNRRLTNRLRYKLSDDNELHVAP